MLNNISRLCSKWLNPTLLPAGPLFHTPVLTQINIRLVMGAVLFGVGWGLVGLCPGPALVDVFSFDASVMWFVAAMLVGNRLAHYFVGPTK